jgi:hypothetical protein
MAERLGKDAVAGFTEWSREFVPTWPFIGDACGIAWRNGKGRLCWDKSGPRNIPHYVPFNKTLPMDRLPVIVYLSVTDVCEVIALMLVPVHMLEAARAACSAVEDLHVLGCLFDLLSAYRVIGRQRRDVWKQGVIWFDMASLDSRLQFGDSSACNTFNRSSNYGVYKARQRIEYVTREYPTRHPLLIQWQQERSSAGLEALLAQVMAYFDDIPVCGFDDLLYDRAGRPVIVDGQHKRRIHVVFTECQQAFIELGHQPEPSKNQLPSLQLTCQGALIDIETETLCIHPDKRIAYSADIDAIIEDGPRCPRHALNSIAHKLMYCASIMVRLRPWLFYIFRCLHRTQFSQSVFIDEPAAANLRKCQLALQHGQDHTVPLAWREEFPCIGSGALAQYADAAGDGLNPGYGVWWVEGRELFIIDGVWSPDQLALPIHVLEFWTNSMGLEAAWTHNHEHQFIVEYTDNAAAEVIGDSQYSRSESMVLIADWRADLMDATGLCALPQRVTSADNEWADWLSRGKRSDVLAAARSLGLSVTLLSAPPSALRLLSTLVATIAAPSTPR